MKFLTNIAGLYTLVTTYPCGLKSQPLKRKAWLWAPVLPAARNT